jgi:sugar lactone lactonase YvrE
MLPGIFDNGRVLAQSAAPLVKKISPDEIPVGTETYTIRVQGRGFSTDARIFLDGSPLPTSRVVDKKGRLALAEINSSVVANVGTHQVKLVNGDGQSSQTFTFNVIAKDPNLRMRLGGNASEEGHGVDLIFPIDGEGFNEDSQVITWGFQATVTQLQNDGSLITQMDAGLTDYAARIPIYVHNKGGAVSNAEIFFIVPAPARLDSIEPDTAEVGSEDVEIAIRGDFKKDAIVLVNGVPFAATAKRAGKLIAIIPASLMTQTGRVFVRVEQDGVQTGDLIFTIAPPKGEPVIFDAAPTRIRLGDVRPAVDLFGANLGDTVTVTLDGQKAKLRTSTRTQLSVVVPEEKQTSLGTHTIEVSNEDGKTASVTFEIVPDVQVSTLVGAFREGFNEDCASAEEARFRRPRRIAIGPDHFVYVTDQQNHAIRRINPTTGEVCTIAGTTGLFGYSDSGNSAGMPVSFSFPNGLVVTNDGTIFVTENGNDVVRRIVRNGSTVTVDTVAGTTEPIPSGPKHEKLNATKEGFEGFRDGAASSAAFRNPDEIVKAPDGSLYFTDPNNHAIRKLTQNGSQFTVQTIAGNGVPGFVDGDALAARFNTPTGLAISADGNTLYVADTFNQRVRKIDLLTLRVSTFAGDGSTGGTDGPGFLASFTQPVGLAVDASGILYVSEMGPGRIRRIDQTGNVTPLAGDDKAKYREGPGSQATFKTPRGLAIDGNVLYVADYENLRIRKIQLQ